MVMINTVCGPVNTDELGKTLTHEHLFVGPAGSYKEFPELLDADVFEKIVVCLVQAKRRGVDTLVDATTSDLGRDVDLLEQAAKVSGMNIIACTGWWLDFPRYFEGISADQLADVFVREIEEGIAGSEVKAGVLKSASGMEGVTRHGETVLRAIALAHHRTNVPIMLHTYTPGQVSSRQLAILMEGGVAPNRVKIDHALATADVDYLAALLDKGCFLSMDAFPGRGASPATRAKTMKALMDAGYSDRLCPSHDYVCARIRVASPEIPDEERLKMNPHALGYIQKEIFPMLAEMGVSESALEHLLVNGPRNFFEKK